jgi:outer membrane protein assembly factor BamB
MLTAPNAMFGDNWAGWRGPGRNGVSHESGLPLKWSSGENVAWKAPLPGMGVGGPIIWGDRIFVTDCDGPHQANLHVICLARDSGRELWHDQFWGTAPTLHHDTKSSMATPVPVTDGQFVFAFFGTGDVFCTTVEGELVWQRSLASEYGAFENRFAASSSPVLYENLMIVQCDHYGDSYVLAIDKATGATAWKVDRPGYWHSWASPQLVPVAGAKSPPQGRFELVLCGSEKLDAFDPATGRKLWTVTGMLRECIPTPVFDNGLIYAVSGPKGPTLAVRPGGRGDVTNSHVAWSAIRGAPFVPSAIVVGPAYELVDDAGVLTCLDAIRGTRRWQSRLPGRYTASPLAGDGKLYFFNEDGMTTVISSRAERFQVLSQNAIDEPIFATPAISQGQLFIRAPSRLWCIGGAARPQRSTEVKEKPGRRQSQTESKLSPAGHFVFAVAPATRP